MGKARAIYPKGNYTMFDDLDLAELGLDLPEEKVAALKETFATKAKEAIDHEVTGLKKKNSELLGQNKTLKTEFEQFQSQLEGLDLEAIKGLDLSAIKGLLEEVGRDEEKRLIAEGKIDEVFNRRTERFRQDVEKQIKAKEAEIARHIEANQKLASRALSDAILQAASKAGALPEAMEDIVERARRAGWTVNEDGDVVAMDGDEPILGKDGKTPLTPAEWAESLRESAPHLWPRAVGAGPTGDKGAKGAKKRSEMSAEEVAAFIKEHGREAYLKLPK